MKYGVLNASNILIHWHPIIYFFNIKRFFSIFFNSFQQIIPIKNRINILDSITEIETDTVAVVEDNLVTVTDCVVNTSPQVVDVVELNLSEPFSETVTDADDAPALYSKNRTKNNL